MVPGNHYVKNETKKSTPLYPVEEGDIPEEPKPSSRRMVSCSNIPVSMWDYTAKLFFIGGGDTFENKNISYTLININGTYYN